MVFPKLNGMNDFLFPGNINLTGKLLYFAEQSSDSVTICRRMGVFLASAVCLFLDHSARKKILPLTLYYYYYFKSSFWKKHVAWDTVVPHF